MNLADLRAELEADRAWRDEEIRAFQNQGSTIADKKEMDRYRRALILLLYAHYEGFCKVAFTLYATAINNSGISCGEANCAIAAASLHEMFRNLRDPNMKSDIFRHALPNDSQLHRFARDREFVERTSEIEKRPVKIPDNYVDTESNLKPVVMKKNLYRLGLPHDQFEEFDGDISKLLRIRNGVSHGDLKDGVEETVYLELRTTTFAIMSGLSAGIMKALSDRAYART
jgi:hypothetical protein